MSDKEEKGSLEEYGVYLLSEEIDSESCASAMSFILLENLKRKHDHLTLIVNSPGGDVDSGFALIDVINGSKIPVHTVGLGIIASMGLLIFISGSKGNRVLTPNTLIMSHQFTAWNVGKEHELIASRKGHDIVSKMFMRHYKKHTDLSEDDIRKYLIPASDMWISAKDARSLGLCDVVKDI